MALTDTAVKNAKPREKPYKMGDSLGLFLLVQPSGGRLWRLKYRRDGKEQKLALGAYPEISLKVARERRDEARSQLAQGLDPSREKRRKEALKRVSEQNTFELVAREYFEKRRNDGDKPWSTATAGKNEYLLSLLAPSIGNLPLADMMPGEVLDALRKIERKGTLESARRAQQLASQVFRYGVATARVASDPTRDLKDALRKPKVKHRAAILEPNKLGELLRAIDGYEGHIYTKLALQMAPYVFVRPGELRQACWEEIDFNEAVWTIPAHKAKMRKPHSVPLAPQVLAIFEQAKELTSRTTGYVFPGLRTSSRPLSENTLNAALRRLGFSTDEVTSHGFRATASTLLNQARDPRTKRPLWSADAIEKALAHGDADKVRAAYHRGNHWEQRVEMAQWWADYLDHLRSGADILKFPGRAEK